MYSARLTFRGLGYVIDPWPVTDATHNAAVTADARDIMIKFTRLERWPSEVNDLVGRRAEAAGIAHIRRS